MQLIDKDKVISILQDKIADIKLDMKCGFLKKKKGDEKILILKHIISLVNTLEVKEVDLDKEIDKWYDNKAPKEFENVFYEDIEKCAKHFFELGLNAQKGE